MPSYSRTTHSSLFRGYFTFFFQIKYQTHIFDFCFWTLNGIYYSLSSSHITACDLPFTGKANVQLIDTSGDLILKHQGLSEHDVKQLLYAYVEYSPLQKPE